MPSDRRTIIVDLHARSPDRNAGLSRGIGLAFCRVVAQAHGGRIDVHDRAPRGSRFEVELPVRRPGPP